MEEGKVFSTGVVSYSLFSNFNENQRSLLSDIEFLCDAGSQTDDPGSALDIIEHYVYDANKKLDEYWEKGNCEKDESGGNDVKVIHFEKKPRTINRKEK